MLTAEQKRTVFMEGGLREVVKLAGRSITLGELRLRDRHKLFECMEGDLHQVERTWREYMRTNRVGLLPALGSLLRSLLGIEEKQRKAISLMKELIEGLTENDIKLLLLCAGPFTEGITEKQLRELALDAPASEVQYAIHKALEINGIDTKKFQAVRELPIPPSAAQKTTTMTAGSAES